MVEVERTITLDFQRELEGIADHFRAGTTHSYGNGCWGIRELRRVLNELDESPTD